MHHIVHRCLFTYGRGTQASALRLRSYFVAMSSQCRRNVAATQTKTPAHLCRDRHTTPPTQRPAAKQTKPPAQLCRDSDVGTLSKSSRHKKLAQFLLQRTQLTMSELRNVIPLFLRGITLHNGLIHKCVHCSRHLADDGQHVYNEARQPTADAGGKRQAAGRGRKASGRAVAGKR